MLRIVILVFFLSRASLASEPQCSRFHYEEKTLEKMIKLEILVQKMKADIDTIEKRVADTLRDLENEREELKLELENEREITKKELGEMKEMIGAEIQKAEEVIKNVTDSPASTPTVAFTVKEQTGASWSNNQIVIYGDIIKNEGTGYDATTGIFTAPVAGTYMFSVQFCTPSGDGIGFAVMSKDKEINRGWLFDSNNESCHSSDAVDVLNKGDRVWIKCTSGAKLLNGVNNWNTFTGVLLHK